MRGVLNVLRLRVLDLCLLPPGRHHLRRVRGAHVRRRQLPPRVRPRGGRGLCVLPRGLLRRGVRVHGVHARLQQGVLALLRALVPHRAAPRRMRERRPSRRGRLPRLPRRLLRDRVRSRAMHRLLRPRVLPVRRARAAARHAPRRVRARAARRVPRVPRRVRGHGVRDPGLRRVLGQGVRGLRGAAVQPGGVPRGVWQRAGWQLLRVHQLQRDAV
mmetsp:Transcript_66635/g.152700  ORF Transcript_66635/g.152700 Transcript_66635/m.152700 type:complete len:215 (+) Transcript_66635:59-703(+)